MTKVIKTRRELFASCEMARRQGKEVAFVPTMGGLHAGHQALIAEAAASAGAFTVVSMFLNPTQFAPDEDLDAYPQDLRGDLALCNELGVDLAFTPSAREMYGTDEQTRVHPGALAARFEGEKRPTHFVGVCTVVTKLLVAVGPCRAIFGQKDFQQLRIVQQLAQDLGLPVEIAAHPIVREADGLACSTRNRYLSDADRLRARALSQCVALVEGWWSKDVGGPEELLCRARDFLAPLVDRIDYLELADTENLQPATPETSEVVFLVAATVGRASLIDNVVLRR